MSCQLGHNCKKLLDILVFLHLYCRSKKKAQNKHEHYKAFLFLTLMPNKIPHTQLKFLSNYSLLRESQAFGSSSAPPHVAAAFTEQPVDSSDHFDVRRPPCRGDPLLRSLPDKSIASNCSSHAPITTSCHLSPRGQSGSFVSLSIRQLPN